MRNTFTVLLVIVIIAAIAFGGYLYLHTVPQVPPGVANTATTTEVMATTTPEEQGMETIGKSVEGRDISAYHFGTGDTEVVFVGGLHGGYDWNTSLVAYQIIDYLNSSPSAVPAGERVTVIPVVNPDGLAKVVDKAGAFTASDVDSGADTVAARFNTNDVDLNRNFDCDWQATGVWQSKSVSGGTAAFSEPESKAIEQYVGAHKPAAVVVYYSAAGGVYASNCHSGVLPETDTLTSLYAKAAGYSAHESFDFYETTGDMTNWLAKEGVPAISVLLTNHTDSEWDKNKAGVDAVLAHYGQ
jgi:hypothetical protein